MDDLLAARLTMAVSLGFHIVLAAIGMVMPFLMSLAHRRWLRTGEDDAYRLTKIWTRGVAIFFATGAVSGTALSFELGLLWPEFMLHAGPIIGMPFSLEGTAFFIEAIALGLYLYGWERMHPKLHFYTGILVGVMGVASGILVVAANGWMNAPTGFDWVNGVAENVDPWAAMANPAWATQSTHMTLAAFQAVGFAAAGVHALLLLRNRGSRLHKMAIKFALMLAIPASLLQPLNGHWAAQDVAERQPIKLAAMEGHFDTEKGAPLIIGGIPNEEAGETRYAVEIPGLLSFMAFDDFEAEVKGLKDFPRELWPPVAITHIAFQIMVGIGTLLAAVAVLSIFVLWKQPEWLEHRRYLLLLLACAPLGFVAIEAGWTVTEVGRQPWIIYGIMKTSEAVTPVPGQVWHLALFCGLYLLLSFSAIWMWRRQLKIVESLPAPTPEIRAWLSKAGIQHEDKRAKRKG